jgi:hypothetical protein
VGCLVWTLRYDTALTPSPSHAAAVCSNFKHDSASAKPNTQSWSHANYTTWMRYIYSMQNLTFGVDGGLTEVRRPLRPFWRPF